ncbi:uncharacterized protein LOC124303336 [Neodiprion virginianus]|uniref:uncharacterized protein LOC124303336 n=1 Tax=Neodiprion virginianus TaxID=2961670 RepID=UPI001EE72A72|nr:uncharacterized protein LOC124303336 [Neodiprion virginianus]
MDSTPEGLGTSTHSFTKLEFFSNIKSILKDDISVIHARTQKFLSDKQALPYFLSDDDKRIISDLVSKLRTKWNASNRTEENFKKKNHDWLQKSVELKKNVKRTDLEKTETNEKQPRQIGHNSVVQSPLHEVNAEEQKIYQRQHRPKNFFIL